MSYKPYCAWCNRIGHDVTAECQTRYYKGQFPTPEDKVAVAVAAEREACAKILDECASDWNRIRDPGMANNARCYAKKIRDRSALPSTDGGAK